MSTALNIATQGRAGQVSGVTLGTVGRIAVVTGVITYLREILRAASTLIRRIDLVSYVGTEG